MTQVKEDITSYQPPGTTYRTTYDESGNPHFEVASYPSPEFLELYLPEVLSGIPRGSKVDQDYIRRLLRLLRLIKNRPCSVCQFFLAGYSTSKGWVLQRVLCESCQRSVEYVKFHKAVAHLGQRLHAEEEAKKLREQGHFGAAIPSKSRQNSSDIKLAKQILGQDSPVVAYLVSNLPCIWKVDLPEEESFARCEEDRGSRSIVRLDGRICGAGVKKGQRHKLHLCEAHYQLHETIRKRVTKREQREAEKPFTWDAWDGSL